MLRATSLAAQRTKTLRLIATALRRALSANLSRREQEDILAFVVLALGEVRRTLDETTLPWEKRGYWIKADRFRQNWTWVGTAERRLDEALRHNDLAGAGGELAALAVHISGKDAPTKSRESNPWNGAFDEWRGTRQRWPDEG